MTTTEQISKEKFCTTCSKFIGTGEYDGKFCEVDCDNRFCSDDCADIESLENTFPNCYPGIYWCGLCRKEYVDASKGHTFIPHSHPASDDLKTYIGGDYNFDNGAFVDRCITCKMWHYEFKSQTDIPGKYEGVACSAWLIELEE